MNLPRSERFKPQNVILVGVIPGPHELRLNINSYDVAQLNKLWTDGIIVKAHGSMELEVFRGALLCGL